MAADVLTPGQQIKAVVDVTEVKRLLEQRYGLVAKTIVELDAYDDRNYRVLCEETVRGNPYIESIAKDGYVLKIINSLDSKNTDFFDAQNELLIFLSKKNIACSIPVKQKNGAYCSLEMLGDNGQKNLLRLLIYYPGETLGNVAVSAELFVNLGKFVGTLDSILAEFSHSGYENRTSLWVLEAVPKLRNFLFAVKNQDDSKLVEEIISSFETSVLPVMDSLSKGIIHGDLNESNIIVSSDNKDIAAIIDFGDSHKNCYVFELAITLCYMVVKANDLAMGRYVIEGYNVIKPLSQKEREILKLCVCARFAQSLVMATYSHQREPENLYLIRDHETKWQLLKKLWRMRDTRVMDMWNIRN